MNNKMTADEIHDLIMGSKWEGGYYDSEALKERIEGLLHIEKKYIDLLEQLNFVRKFLR